MECDDRWVEGDRVLKGGTEALPSHAWSPMRPKETTLTSTLVMQKITLKVMAIHR